jgi:hypothetical protein
VPPDDNADTPKTGRSASSLASQDAPLKPKAKNILCFFLNHGNGEFMPNTTYLLDREIPVQKSRSDCYSIERLDSPRYPAARVKMAIFEHH